MDSIPEVSLQQMKCIKVDFVDKVITGQNMEPLGNAARLLSSWIDGVLEFTILKHEVIVLRLKHTKVISKIRLISKLWPKKKEFIEGAYKLLLFTKNSRKQVAHTLCKLREGGLFDFMDFKEACNRVLKQWYEKRIQEESERNKKLRDLHDNLIRLKELREAQPVIKQEDLEEEVKEETKQ